MSKKDSISGDNSLFFSKTKSDLDSIKSIKSNTLSEINNAVFAKPTMPDLRNLLKKPDLTPQEILTFLKENSAKQSETAIQQFKTIKLLSILSLTFVVISTLLGFKDIIFPTKNNNTTEQITRIIETQSLNTKVLSELSIRLLDLQNQVQTLEKQNREISKKKND